MKRIAIAVCVAVLVFVVAVLAALAARGDAVGTAAPMVSDELRSAATTQPHPSARGYALTAYDWTTGMAYLFGGVDRITPLMDYPLQDVWSFNSVTQEWKQLFQDSDSSFYNPFQRDAIALDPRSKKIVLYSTFVNCDWNLPYYGVETWIYNIRRNTFKNVTSGTEPPVRWGSSMVYDTESGRAILFGGSDAYTGETLNDTWAYDFETNTWTLMAPAVSPPPHHFSAMAYHRMADRVVLFGGYDIWQDTVLNDTWAYDHNTNTWTELHPDVSPPPRLYHKLTWDEQSNRIILFGGVSYPYKPVLGDTWALDLSENTWTPLTPRQSPSPRAWHIMEGTRFGVLMFGGSHHHSPFTIDDTWIYNSNTNQWVKIDY